MQTLDELLKSVPDGNIEICAHGSWLDGMRVWIDPVRPVYRIPIACEPGRIPSFAERSGEMLFITIKQTQRRTYDGRIVYEVLR